MRSGDGLFVGDGYGFQNFVYIFGSLGAQFIDFGRTEPENVGFGHFHHIEEFFFGNDFDFAV